MIINLTPHVVRVFKTNIDDVITWPSKIHVPIIVFDPSDLAVRLSVREFETISLSGVQVRNVKYGDMYPSIKQTTNYYYIVSLVTALAARRSDFFFPYLPVRNQEGTQVGCKMLARLEL